MYGQATTAWPCCTVLLAAELFRPLLTIQRRLKLLRGVVRSTVTSTKQQEAALQAAWQAV